MAKKQTQTEKVISEKAAKAEAKAAEAKAAEKAEEKATDEAKAKVEKAKSAKNGVVQVVVLEGFGEKFGTDKIQDGTILTLPKKNAVPLVKKGFVKLK
jgi:hypothetical protein